MEQHPECLYSPSYGYEENTIGPPRVPGTIERPLNTEQHPDSLCTAPHVALEITIAHRRQYYYLESIEQHPESMFLCVPPVPHEGLYTGSHGVLQWSLSVSMGSYKGLQYQVRGLAGSQGTV